METVRFGRVLFVETAPAEDGHPRRYDGVLSGPDRRPTRAHFTAPEAASRAILTELERGVSVDAVVFGGEGDPLRAKGLNSILRTLRQRAHVTTMILTDGRLLADRDVRREVSEAGWLVPWLPAQVDSRDGDERGRAARFERHVEALASFAREYPVPLALELPVAPGHNDGEASVHAWSQALRRTKARRAFVIPAPGFEEAPDIGEALERVRAGLPSGAGAYLHDGTLVDQRGEFVRPDA